MLTFLRRMWFTLTGSSSKMELYNLEGKKLAEKEDFGSIKTLNSVGISEGLYLLKIKAKNYQSTEKLIIN